MKIKPFTSLISGFGILAVLAFATSSYLFLFLQENAALIERADPSTMLIFFTVVCFTMAFGLTPTTFVAILTGHFFSWAGLFFLIISYLVAAVVSLLVFKKINHRLYKYIHEENKKLSAFAKGLEDREFLLIFLLRLSPIFPFAIMNMILSTLHIRWKDYLPATFLGMIPRTVIFFVAGKNVVNVWDFLKHPSLEGGYRLIPVILIIVSVVGIARIIRKSLMKVKK